MVDLGEVVGYKLSYYMLKRLLTHIDKQTNTILSLKEYTDALENSFVLREVTRRFAIPPPG